MNVLPQDFLENIDKLTVENCADSPFWGSALSQFIAHTHTTCTSECIYAIWPKVCAVDNNNL